jgi:hypothetical protein
MNELESRLDLLIVSLANRMGLTSNHDLKTMQKIIELDPKALDETINAVLFMNEEEFNAKIKSLKQDPIDDVL